MLKTLTRAAVAALALAVAVPAVQAKTVTDVLGREVDVPDDPQRVLLGFYFEDFFAIVGPDAYDRVVAISRDAWEGWRNLQWQAYTKAVPEIEDIADIGEIYAGTFSIETALAAKPDVAILAEWQFTALEDVIDKLEAAGVPVVVADYNAQTVDKHVASTKLIGSVMGAEERAAELADLYATSVADVQDRVAKAGGTPKRVYMELGNKGPDEHGNSWSKSMWGNIVTMAGGENIADGQIAKWAPLNPEYVLASDPQVILIPGAAWVSNDVAVVMGPGVDTELTAERIAPYLDRPGWQDLSAVKDGEVYGVYHGGTRTLYDFAYLQYIAKILYPDAFQDIDPQRSLEGFFDAYMPIEASGAYMMQMPK